MPTSSRVHPSADTHTIASYTITTFSPSRPGFVPRYTSEMERVEYDHPSWPNTSFARVIAKWPSM